MQHATPRGPVGAAAEAGLIRETVLQIDTKQPDEKDVNLSHWHSFDDRESGDIVIPMARASEGYKSRQPVLYVIAVDK